MTPSARSRGAGDSEGALKFGTNRAFQLELRRRVDEYFRTTGRRQRDCWQMYLKAAIVMASLAISYLLLVFAAHAWWQSVPLAVVVGFAAAGIGFNIQHDGGHHAYSDRRWINKLMAMTLDFIGGSSYLWHWKHGIIHHTYVNVTGHDSDLNLGIFGRVTPHQRRLAFHRWQHLYLWPLYGCLAIRWQLIDDFRRLIAGRIGSHRIRRPRGTDLVILVAGKATFFAWAFGVPLLFHSVSAVLVHYGIAALVLGTTLSVVFQVAHCVEEAAFPPAHVNYPAISTLMEQTCRDFGVKYTEHRSFWHGVTAHFRWLRRMGMPSTNDRPRPPEAAPSF